MTMVIIIVIVNVYLALSVRHCAKYFVCSVSFNCSNFPEVDPNIPILWMK